MDAPRCIDGTLVVEIAEGWSAGAVAGRLLAELGARVLKVEPLAGDRLRRQGPNAADGSSPTFRNLNTGKESVALDVATAGGQEALVDLIAHADIVITDQTTMQAHGLAFDAAALAERNPGLVLCHFSPFGCTGPLAGRPGGDLVAQAMGGIVATTGYPDKLPCRAGPPLAVHNAALLGGTAILAALLDRPATGESTEIDMALYDGAVSLLYTFIPGYFISGNAPGPQGNRHPMAAPWDNYPTGDGWIILCTADDRQWRNFLGMIGRPELADDPRFATNDQRVVPENRAAIDAMVLDFLSGRTTAEALDVLAAHQVPAGPIHDLRELIADPQFLARGMVQMVEDGAGGRYRACGSIFKMSETPGRLTRPAPSLNLHGPWGEVS